MSKNFESWVFSVNFGSSDLYLKHSPFMKIAYNARNEEIDSLKKEVERLRSALENIEHSNNVFDFYNSDIQELITEALSKSEEL